MMKGKWSETLPNCLQGHRHKFLKEARFCDELHAPTREPDPMTGEEVFARIAQNNRDFNKPFTGKRVSA